MGIRIGEFFEADERQPLARLALRRPPALAAFLQAEHHVAPDAEPGEQRIALEHHAEIRAGSLDGSVVDEDDSAGRGLQAGEDANERRFSAARWSDHAEEFAAVGIDRDVAERDRRLAVGEFERLAEALDAQSDLARLQLVETRTHRGRLVEIGEVHRRVGHASAFAQGNIRRPSKASAISVPMPTKPIVRIPA